jgi:adenine-specific DNA-methyltransferase
VAALRSVHQVKVESVRMDCADNLTFTQSLPDASIQLVVTSPPYNISKPYERSKATLDDYVQKQSRVISECVRVLHERGSLCWQVGNYVNDGEIFPLDVVLYNVFKQHDLRLRNRIIWHFEHGLHGSRRLSGRYETMLWFTKGDTYTFNLDAVRVPSKYPKKKYYKGPKAGQYSCNPLGKNPGDVWIIPNVKWNHVEKTAHPCQFPVELIERVVLMLTDEGDALLDPYMGVGSAIVAAVKHGRVGYGCDNVKAYVDQAWERIHALREGRLRTRPMERPIYDPLKTSRR